MNPEPLLRRLEPEEARRARRDVVPPEILAAASDIVERVRREGEVALREFASRFDELEANAPVRWEQEALAETLATRPAAERELLERTADRIRRFARAQRECLHDLETTIDGARMGHHVRPVPVAGCYAPGGRFPLPSTVLMTAVTARAAGVPEVVVASPRPTATTLAAAAVAGADAVLAVGGAHAIAAMAFGTASVPACDVIVGPGNAWVTAAKQIVAGRVRIDSLAGPSELLVVADAGTDPRLVAADLLAQAEHDPMAVPSLIVLDPSLLAPIEAELRQQLHSLSTATTARSALSNGFAIVAADAQEAVDLCNALAPEHLQWMVSGHDDRIGGLVHYGGLFLGSGAAEVLGDYGAGPNHVLPTGGSARSRGGLSVQDFLKVSTWLAVEDAEARRSLARDASDLARIEGLVGHQLAARLRAGRIAAREPGRRGES